MSSAAKSKASNSIRHYKLIHQLISLTGINFSTKSIIGYVELTLKPSKENLKHIRLNAKQCRVYRVCLNNELEAPFQYCDPILEVFEGDTPQKNLESFSEAHLSSCNLVDPDLNGGELNIRIPSEAYQRGFVSSEKLLKVGIEFSLEEPQGGVHFVVPKDEMSYAHLFTCSYEESASRLWFPCIDTLSELCTWKLEFTVDENMIAVASGDLTETVYTPDFKRKTFHYSLNVPTAAPNIALAVGPFEIWVDPNMNEVTHFCLPHLLPVLKATVKNLHESIEYYETTLLTTFPYSCYKQVFVDEAYSEVAAYSTMSIMSTTLLHSTAIIDQTYLTRRIGAEAVAAQFFGCFITTERWSDIWLNKGISKYLMGLYIRKTFGNNEYRNMIHTQMDKVVNYEEKYGGIILDSSQPPAPPPVRGEQQREPTKEENQFVFQTTNVNTCSPEYMEMYALKAHLVVRMLANRIGDMQLIQVLNKQLSLASNAVAQSKQNVSSWSNMIINTLVFTRSIFTVTGKDMGVFMDQWVRTGGHARFHMEFVFNRKRNTIEMQINQDAAHQGHRGIRRYVGQVTVAVQELDGWFSYTLAVENIHSKHDITCHSKSRRNKKKKIPLQNNEEVDMDLSAMDDSPILWIRVDPDMQLIRSLDIRQPDFQWQYQLRHERDVTAQSEAVISLENFPSNNTSKALRDIIEDEQCFYKVRCQSTHCLAKVANAMASSWEGPPPMLLMFKKLYGSFAAGHIIKQNDFSNLQSYFLQKEIPVAMAKLRNAHRICPPEVLKFLLDLFKYNDNSKNSHADNYYRAALVEALGHTVTPVVSVIENESAITAESLSPDTKLILEEITRFLNLEKLLPCYKYTVTVSCLRAIRKLQKTGHLPPNPSLFRDYATYGQFIDIRICALECLVDFTSLEGKSDDIDHLLKIIENDPVPFIRHKLCRLIVDNPFFERAKNHKNDRYQLVERLWSLMNTKFWYDSRLRCDIVDIYFKLYGRKKPVCMPLPELQAILAPQRVQEDKTSKADKKKFHDTKSRKKEVRPTRINVPYTHKERGRKTCDTGRPLLATADIPEYFNLDDPSSLPTTPIADDSNGEPSHKPHKEKKKKKDKKRHKHKHKKHKHEHKSGSASKHKKQSAPGDTLGMNEASQGLSSGSSSPSPSNSPDHDMTL
ncbi:transcription initiation factor TFIID subunit 2 [Lepeophtheirus salmonis]|uniref:transcription initiation factor TFIID subunit 2 n=1 Tax=Lepeophtheirus salmonis TaxID=72036 RepID=UPI003AF3C4D0